MLGNIMVAVMTIAVTAIAVYCWWGENHGGESKK